MAEEYVVIVGGLNLDVAGLSGKDYREHDSNIGRIEISAGGVGHNIAQNLTRYDVPTYLVTVYGDDYFGEILVDQSEESNIRLDYAEKIEGQRSSSYLYVTDNEGDMVTGINDMGIVDLITPEFLEKRLDFINGAKICVIDANISKESIEWLAERCKVPIFVDPVSVAKAGRLENVLDKIDTIKPNEYEAELLSGIKVVDKESAIEAAKALVAKGVKNVFISLGAKGILGSDKETYHFVKPIPGEVVSVNGAGDCSMATITWARYYYDGALDVGEVCYLTQAAARLTVSSSEAVSPDLNVTNVVKLASASFGAE